MKTFSTIPCGEDMKEISCIVCGSSDYVIHWNCKECSFVKCKNCRLIYQNPQPASQDLLKRYNQEYFKYERENEVQFFRLMKLGLKDIGFKSLEKQLSGNKTFLDIGCATGMLISWLKEKGWMVQGVDICRSSALYGIRERGLNISIGTLESLKYKEENFSVIHCSHLIEHLTDPKAFLKEINRILKKDGYLILSTPNVDGFQAKLFKEDWRSAIADHMYLFSKKTLKTLLKSTGFKVIKYKTWGGLAKGTAPLFIKKIADSAVKKTWSGDVMILVAKKEN